MTESDVIRQAKTGDREALHALYEVHVDRVYGLALRMTGDEELARDLAQDTFVRAFERLGDFRGESSFGTWIHTIAVRLTLNRTRRRRWWWARVRALETGSSVVEPLTEEGREVRRRVRAAVDELPEIYRTVVIMHEVEGFTHEEIGAALGVAVGTSKARLSRAKERLRERLGDLLEDRSQEWNTASSDALAGGAG